jgi:hypothetical protein
MSRRFLLRDTANLFSNSISPAGTSKWGKPLGEVAFGPESKHDLRSITKSVIALLLGIPNRARLGVKSADTPVLNLLYPENAHVRLDAASGNNGGRILHRGYSYNNGLAMIAERWPPWRQSLEYDAGLLFLAFQRDRRSGFVKIFANMSKLDLLNQFTTHVGSGIFACPGGLRPGEYIGQSLLQAA